MDTYGGKNGRPTELVLRDRPTCVHLAVTETDAPEATLRTLRVDDDMDWLQRASGVRGMERRQSKGKRLHIFLVTFSATLTLLAESRRLHILLVTLAPL
jgi:hypothetical protein